MTYFAQGFERLSELGLHFERYLEYRLREAVVAGGRV